MHCKTGTKWLQLQAPYRLQVWLFVEQWLLPLWLKCVLTTSITAVFHVCIWNQNWEDQIPYDLCFPHCDGEKKPRSESHEQKSDLGHFCLQSEHNVLCLGTCLCDNSLFVSIHLWMHIDYAYILAAGTMFRRHEFFWMSSKSFNGVECVCAAGNWNRLVGSHSLGTSLGSLALSKQPLAWRDPPAAGPGVELSVRGWIECYSLSLSLPPTLFLSLSLTLSFFSSFSFFLGYFWLLSSLLPSSSCLCCVFKALCLPLFILTLV